jgi:hypothetical protein
MEPPTSLRLDAHLITILDETTAWAVCDEAGMVLYTAASLRAAVIEATAYQATLSEEITICRRPADDIVLFREQIHRLMETMT